jgi:hypothetical protein
MTAGDHRKGVEIMGRVKELQQDLLERGVSNVYTVTMTADIGGKVTTFERYTLREAKAKAFELAETNFRHSIIVEALHLRTGRLRYVHKDNSISEISR